MDWFREMRAHYQIMGPMRFAIFFGGLTGLIVAFGTIGWWLGEKVGWPEKYGFQCHGRRCFWLELFETPRLLRHGGSYELVLFLWFWLVPGGTAAAIAFVLLKRRIARHRNRIRPLDYN